VTDESALARKVREHAIRMTAGGGCFLGASLSCVEILVALYTRFLRISPETVEDPDRDTLLLSKGHDVPALYGLLAELGYLERERLTSHLSPKDTLYWHPNRAVRGVEFHSGSLGHLLAVGVGIAYEARLRKSAARVAVVVGDGELNEGSVWEALLVASAWELDSLYVIVDRNGFQANARTEELVPLEPLVPKLEAFGCDAARVDGHDVDALSEALERPGRRGRPRAVVADTVRGKGLPSIEARVDRWFCRFSDAEVASLLDELHGELPAELLSDTLVVR
jgi:transketolase